MKNPARIIPVLFLFAACGGNDEIKIPEEPIVIGLASPVQLPVDTGTIYLQDYISDLSKLDSVSAVKGLELKLSSDKERLQLKVDRQNLAPVSELKVWSKGFAYSIILKRSVKQEVTFEFDSKGVSYKEVQLAGDINNWQPKQTNLVLSNGKWSVKLILNPGNYSYQVVADGKWMLDPANKDSTSNGNGGFNSVLKVAAAGNSVPVLYSVSHEKNKITVASESDVSEWFVLWENFRLPEGLIKNDGNKIEITLPKAAADKERSALRVWAYNANGSGNDLLVPLIKNEAVTDPSQLKRDDFHTSIFYFMMVDRFADGDTSNNRPLKDPRVDFKANYQGGDLAGITQKIKDGYFKNLGINTIWVSPIVQNPLTAYQEYPQPRRWFSGYHGYWPVYETKVDTRFGNDEVLKELVETAHKNDMNVIMDFVSNHIHNENPVYKQHPEWFSSMYLPDGTVNIRIWDAQRLTTWFDDFMPDIDYTKPEAVNYFSDSALFWLKKYNLDGFRHDATKHVSETFWRVLTRKVKQDVLAKGERNVYQIGETFGSNELIASYIGSGMMDAQFNFNQYFDVRTVFASEAESFKKVANAMNESALYFGSHNLMGNITGNHDMPRFLYYAGGSERAGEDSKEAGWRREIKVEDPKGYDRLKMLTAFIMTTPGIPIIYYGDEIGMPGANDPDNRRMMQFTGLSAPEEDVKKTESALANLRRSSLALTYGDTRILQAEKDQFVYLRNYFDKTAIVFMNRSNAPIKITTELAAHIPVANVKAHFGNNVKVEGQKITVELKPLAFEVVAN